MGVPRFRPASIFENPRDFGRSSRGHLVATPQLTSGERAWAWYQHHVALVVRAALVKRRSDLDGLAGEIGCDIGWLRRKLHGQAPADLGEMFEWALVLGAQILPSVEDVFGGFSSE
jgi:hypothetical protein